MKHVAESLRRLGLELLYHKRQVYFVRRVEELMAGTWSDAIWFEKSILTGEPKVSVTSRRSDSPTGSQKVGVKHVARVAAPTRSGFVIDR